MRVDLHDQMNAIASDNRIVCYALTRRTNCCKHITSKEKPAYNKQYRLINKLIKGDFNNLITVQKHDLNSLSIPFTIFWNTNWNISAYELLRLPVIISGAAI